jgi:hypothetical protein
MNVAIADNRPFLNTEEAAKYLRCSASTLQQLRMKGSVSIDVRKGVKTCLARSINIS